MNKRMRELREEINDLTKTAKGYMVEGEGRDLDKAAETFDLIDAKEKEYELEARAEKAGKAQAQQAEVKDPAKADGFKAMVKTLNRQAMTDAEKAMVSGDNAANGENYLIPEDVKLEINELRKTYVSAKSIVTVETTEALTGSVNYEDGAPAGLTAFEDGGEIAAADEPKFVRKAFKIGHFGKLIPISRILLGAEKAGLLGYINRWFLRSAVLTENAAIFETLKTGYNEGTPKALAGWKALKKSINVDLDPACKLNGIIVTNQSGWDCLDEAEDKNGRPILRENPADPTVKTFQGLTVHVFPDAQLPNIDATHFPVFYGDTKAGATFVEHKALEFATSEHFGFNKNQNYMRVIEGFDVMSTDTTAYVYGSMTASA
jgi:HK97 family phage major capsid protein